MENRCPFDKGGCPCREYAKEMVCDYPYKNTDLEIMAIRLWGHRLSVMLWSMGELEKCHN